VHAWKDYEPLRRVALPLGGPDCRNLQAQYLHNMVKKNFDPMKMSAHTVDKVRRRSGSGFVRSVDGRFAIRLHCRWDPVTPLILLDSVRLSRADCAWRFASDCFPCHSKRLWSGSDANRGGFDVSGIVML
jgi:hypothetical protein